jgi:hypothetical protein
MLMGEVELVKIAGAAVSIRKRPTKQAQKDFFDGQIPINILGLRINEKRTFFLGIVRPDFG